MESVGTAILQDDRFLVLEALGRGGMGSVYRAFDRIDQRMVAVKVLDDESAPGPSHPLAGEFEAWSRLRHPNVVRAYELGRARRGPLPVGRPYLILEYFPGRPAHRALRPGSCEPAALEEFARRVLQGLGHVHGVGLVHRDLKPANVLVARSRRGPGRVKLTDFGLAEQTGHRDEPGRISGSLPYVAPEAMLGGPVDPRTDLYGLGMLLYYLATGRAAAPTRDPATIVRWHLEGTTPDPRRERPDLSERLARFIRRLTARKRSERPASAAEALLLLGGWMGRSLAGSRPPAARGERARLRLAFDAARLGERRVLRAAGGGRADLACEARVLAQTRGARFIELRPAAAGRCGPGRLVLHLLLERGGDLAARMRRHGLDRGLPLALLGGLPVWDRGRERGMRDGTTQRQTARGIVALLLEAASARTTVLHVASGVMGDPLVRETVALLLRSIEAEPRRPRSGGGLLVLLDAKGPGPSTQEDTDRSESQDLQNRLERISAPPT